jgi:hypothetical protein
MGAGGLHRTSAWRARRLKPSRVLALVLVAVVGCAELSLHAHEIAAQHVRCAVHGELIHVPSGLGRAGTEAPSAMASATGSSSGTFDEHEHCTLLFAAQEGAPPPPALRAVRFTPPPPPLVTAPAAPSLRPGRSYVLASAPKTSPPSV